MQTINRSYVMGTIQFQSNGIDQSTEFLRVAFNECLKTLKEQHKLFFTLSKQDATTIDFEKTYPFEDFVEDQMTTAWTRKDMIDQLVNGSAVLRKHHPKSQLAGLNILIDYKEINEHAHFIQSGQLHLQLDYQEEQDAIMIRVMENKKTILPYTAEHIDLLMEMDAIDTFTTKGIDNLIWHMKDFVDSWKNDADEYPTLNKVVDHLRSSKDPTGFLLSVYEEANLNTIVRVDPSDYIMNEIEDHLEASSTIQQLLQSTVE